MPRGERTGPSGEGRLSGRGLGYCAGYSSPGCARSGPGFGAWPRAYPLEGWRYPWVSRPGSPELSEMMS